jgi:hypothetical protein
MLTENIFVVMLQQIRQAQPTHKTCGKKALLKNLLIAKRCIQKLSKLINLDFYQIIKLQIKLFITYATA